MFIRVSDNLVRNQPNQRLDQRCDGFIIRCEPIDSTGYVYGIHILEY